MAISIAPILPTHSLAVRRRLVAASGPAGCALALQRQLLVANVRANGAGSRSEAVTVWGAVVEAPGRTTRPRPVLQLHHGGSVDEARPRTGFVLLRPALHLGLPPCLVCATSLAATSRARARQRVVRRQVVCAHVVPRLQRKGVYLAAQPVLVLGGAGVTGQLVQAGAQLRQRRPLPLPHL